MKRKSVSIKDANAADLELKKKSKLNSHKIKSAIAVDDSSPTKRRIADFHGKIKLPLPPDISAVNKHSVDKSDACCCDGIPSNADIRHSGGDEGPSSEHVSNNPPSAMSSVADIRNGGKDEVSPSLSEIPSVANVTLSSSGVEGSSNHANNVSSSKEVVADDIRNPCHEEASPLKPTAVEILHSAGEDEEAKDTNITNSELYPVR